MSLRLSAGSFETFDGAMTASVAGAETQFHVVAGARASDSDYPYLDDGNTRFDTTDDVRRRVTNADVLDSYALVHARRDVGAWSLRWLGLVLTRDAGVPGPLASPAPNARSERASLRLGMMAERELPLSFPARLSVRSLIHRGTNRLEDPLGELGILPRDTDDRQRTFWSRAALELAPAPWLDAAIVLDGSGSLYVPDDALAIGIEPRSRRRQISGTAELDIHGDDDARVSWSLRPSARLLGSVGRAGRLHLGRVEQHSSRELLPTFRVGFALAPHRVLTLNAAVYRGARLPSLYELFGDRAGVLANPALRPERGTGGEIGALLRYSSDHLCLEGEGRVHARRDEDGIRARRTSQFQTIFENVESARVLGAEFGLRASVHEWVSLDASFTRLDARDPRGNRLPYRPERLAFARLTLGTGALGIVQARVYADMRHQGRLFADVANFIVIPARTWLGAGAEVRVADVRLSFSVRDLRDRAGSDVLGYALPGTTGRALSLVRQGMAMISHLSSSFFSAPSRLRASVVLAALLSLAAAGCGSDIGVQLPVTATETIGGPGGVVALGTPSSRSLARL